MRCGRFKRWRKMTICCVTCCGPTKVISSSEGPSTPTTAEFGLPRIVETPLHDEKVTVWVGFSTSTVIGPFFSREMRDCGSVTVIVAGERYADMLQNCIIPSLADKHLLEGTIFMQDRAQPYIARRVKDLLRTSFGDDCVLSRHFFMLGLPGLQISVRAIFGFRVT